jgi:hypothetical protein
MLWQVTTAQADCADDKAIQEICKKALQDEGRLDVFFANVNSNFVGLLNVAHLRLTRLA